MKKILFFIVGLILVTGGVISRAETSSAEPEEVVVTDEDSTLNVIGYFCKNDTLYYQITNTRWKFDDKDTVMTSGLAQMVRLVVTDSTDTGYKMEYTFLECMSDSSSDAALNRFQEAFVNRMNKKIIGTKIKFETDEFGAITKFNNLDQIKKQAKDLSKECMKELLKLDEVKNLVKMGF